MTRIVINALPEESRERVRVAVEAERPDLDLEPRPRDWTTRAEGIHSEREGEATASLDPGETPSGGPGPLAERAELIADVLRATGETRHLGHANEFVIDSTEGPFEVGRGPLALAIPNDAVDFLPPRLVERIRVAIGPTVSSGEPLRSVDLVADARLTPDEIDSLRGYSLFDSFRWELPEIGKELRRLAKIGVAPRTARAALRATWKREGVSVEDLKARLAAGSLEKLRAGGWQPPSVRIEGLLTPVDPGFGQSGQEGTASDARFEYTVTRPGPTARAMRWARRRLVHSASAFPTTRTRRTAVADSICNSPGWGSTPERKAHLVAQALTQLDFRAGDVAFLPRTIDPREFSRPARVVGWDFEAYEGQRFVSLVERTAADAVALMPENEAMRLLPGSYGDVYIYHLELTEALATIRGESPRARAYGKDRVRSNPHMSAKNPIACGYRPMGRSRVRWRPSSTTTTAPRSKSVPELRRT